MFNSLWETGNERMAQRALAMVVNDGDSGKSNGFCQALNGSLRVTLQEVPRTKKTSAADAGKSYISLERRWKNVIVLWKNVIVISRISEKEYVIVISYFKRISWNNVIVVVIQKNMFSKNIKVHVFNLFNSSAYMEDARKAGFQPRNFRRSRMYKMFVFNSVQPAQMEDVRHKMFVFNSSTSENWGYLKRNEKFQHVWIWTTRRVENSSSIFKMFSLVLTNKKSNTLSPRIHCHQFTAWKLTTTVREYPKW